MDEREKNLQSHDGVKKGVEGGEKREWERGQENDGGGQDGF